MSDITLPTGQRSILMTPVDINGTVISGAPPTILGTFRAINNGTGYSINDIIVLRQVGSNAPQYYNATTNAVIATPLAADLGNVSTTNVTVSSALPSGSNTIGSIANTTFAATQSGTWNLTNISGTVSLPTGAATSANQATANTSLSSIDGKTPTLGQALASASVPVVLPASQITALTPLSTVGISSLPSLPAGSNTIGAISNTSFGISGTLPAFASTPTFNIGTAPNLTITNTTFAATQSGTWNITNISGTVSLPTGAAISDNQIPAFTVSAKTLGTVNAATVKASAGKVYSLSATNLNASVRYLQIVNKATTPTNSDSASIVDVWTIPANGMIIIDSPYYGANGLSCSTGISWAFSSTATTITLATASDCLVSVGYV